MAKEPQQDLPMTDKIRDMAKTSFLGLQSGSRNNPNRLERYLLLGYALGSLQEYDLIPIIKGGIGANWVPYFMDLWKKVTDPRGLWLEIKLPDDSFIRIQYSVLNPEFVRAMNLFELYGLQGGRPFSSFPNLSEANSYYSTQGFEKLVNDFLARRDLQRQELYAIREELYMEDCSEECSYEEPAPIPIIPESAPAYMPRPTCGPTPGCTPTCGPTQEYAPTCSSASECTPMPQQTCAPQSGFVPASVPEPEPAPSYVPTSAPEPVLVDKVPKKEKVIPEYQRKRERRKKKEKEKEKELPVERDLKNELKRLKKLRKQTKERAEEVESEEEPKEDEPIEISPVKEKEMAPKENTKVVDETEQEPESESEMEPESDFEEGLEKKPLDTMAKRSKRMERDRKRKEELMRPRKREHEHERERLPARETDKKRARDAKKFAKEEFPKIKEMKEKIENGDTDGMEVKEIEVKPERKEKFVVTDEMKIGEVTKYMRLLDVGFEKNILGDNRYHEPAAIYNQDNEEEKRRVFNAPDLLINQQPSVGQIYHRGPLNHYIYLGNDWWYDASLSEKEVTILNFLRSVETEEGRQYVIKTLKEGGLENYLEKNGMPLERELTINDIDPFKPEDRGRNFLWSVADFNIMVDINAVYIRIPGIKRNGLNLFYKVIPNLPTKPSGHQ